MEQSTLAASPNNSPTRIALAMLTIRSLVILLATLGLVSHAGAFADDTKKPKAKPADKQPADKPQDKKKWRSLFDGKTLKGWKESNFYGESKVYVKDGAIVMTPGVFMAGVTATQKIPKINYEVSLEAMRVKGTDFFCGLTFPVKDDFCSLIVGGWGGGVVGLSSLNGMDASENETTLYRQFENGKWYPIKLRVTGQRITAWIDGKEQVDVDIEGDTISTRLEVEWSKPFGIASWSTTGAIRNIKIRKLPPAEVKKVNTAKLHPEE